MYINNQLVCEKTRDRWYSWLSSSQKLTAKIEVGNQSKVVKVKLGGIIFLNCKVYVDKELIFKEKLKINPFSAGNK